MKFFKGIVAAVVGMAFIWGAMYASANGPVSSDLLERQTVLVDLGAGHGSGVLFSDDTILTAAHVAGKGTNVVIEFSDGTKIAGTSVWSDEDTDTAIVKLSEKYTKVKGAGLKCETPKVGSILHAIGNPLGGKWVHSWLTVASSRAWPESNRGYVVAGAVAPGMSGGPVFDYEGMVVGLVTALYITPLGFSPSVSGFGNLSTTIELCKQLQPISKTVR